MALLDIISIILLAILAIKGFSKGLVLEIASLAALFVGAVVGLKLMHYVASYLSEELGWNGKWLLLIAFIFVFALVVLVMHILARALEKMLKLVALGFLNRLGGSVFGIIKGAFILSLVFWMLDNSGFVTEEVFNKTQIAQHILRFAPTTFNVFANVVPLLGELLEDLGQVFENLQSEN